MGYQRDMAPAVVQDDLGSGDPNSALLQDVPGGNVRHRLHEVARYVATFACVAIALVIAILTWQYYVSSPWTRNGSVRVQVANVAPQVSGQIIEIKVADNQFVHKGDVLYVIDPFDFQVAQETAKSQLDRLAADLQVKQAQSQRRQHLSSDATTPEEQQVFLGAALEAKAAYEGAGQQLRQADLNLKRTQVLSPVNGYVTNLLLRVGDYAVQGQSNIAVIDSDSFWVDGYFEETKMARICVGDRAEAQLIGYAEPVEGHVETITRGISVANAGQGVQGLPNVNPIYTWVRLAQRVPVRIAIDKVPQGVPLVSGMTATVTIGGKEGVADRSLDTLLTTAAMEIRNFVYGPATPSPHCQQAGPVTEVGREALAVPVEPSIPAPEQIAPGLVPALDASPLTSETR
ncbi:RND family efflux transporter MFP subunit [Ancylobacter sp. 3268]|uniref:HlyD family secretion protein n=1 Tax=Ancylobacter sp. 3268 TaxID=2817752 RepID=UPI002867A893|nr:HlyD family secretion protein [Ancylobacter sp. 3268]MDR6955535.1 RND family efflux transporter MFP subunit [Ancylobacter sp. 3268]